MENRTEIHQQGFTIARQTKDELYIKGRLRWSWQLVLFGAIGIIALIYTIGGYSKLEFPIFILLLIFSLFLNLAPFYYIYFALAYRFHITAYTVMLRASSTNFTAKTFLKEEIQNIRLHHYMSQFMTRSKVIPIYNYDILIELTEGPPLTVFNFFAEQEEQPKFIGEKMFVLIQSYFSEDFQNENIQLRMLYTAKKIAEDIGDTVVVKKIERFMNMMKNGLRIDMGHGIGSITDTPIMGSPWGNNIFMYLVSYGGDGKKRSKETIIASIQQLQKKKNRFIDAYICPRCKKRHVGEYAIDMLLAELFVPQLVIDSLQTASIERLANYETFKSKLEVQMERKRIERMLKKANVIHHSPIEIIINCPDCNVQLVRESFAV